MVSAVFSSSAALKVLQTRAPQQAGSGQQERDTLQRFLDPRSVLALAPQSLDALLKLRTELRRGSLEERQIQNSVSPTSSDGAPPHSGMLAWENNSHGVVERTNLDLWNERIEQLKAHTSGSLKDPLMPWNSPDVLQEVLDTDRHGANASARERAFLASDAAIYRGMAETPSEDVARIKSLGGEVWYESDQFYDRISDKEFFRNIKNMALYGVDLDQPIDPSSKLSQAILNGTAQMIRGSNIPGFYERSYDYDMYAYSSEADQYKWIGGWSRGESNVDKFYDDLVKNNPTMHVTKLWGDGDVAFVMYPKDTSTTPTATAVAQSTTTETGTSRASASAR
jgi:hypothetical protein